jgi:hypothetical protein
VSKRKAEDATADGFTVVLIDCPQRRGRRRARRQREGAQPPPLLGQLHAQRRLSWRTEVINNVETLTQVVLREGTA